MRAEIYTGIYKTPQNHAYNIPTPKIRVMNYYLGYNIKTKRKSKQKKVTFVVEDGSHNFWPVILKFTGKEAKKLGRLLINSNSSFEEQEVKE